MRKHTLLSLILLAPMVGVKADGMPSKQHHKAVAHHNSGVKDPWIVSSKLFAGHFKDNSSYITHLKGHNQGVIALLGYRFSPHLAVNATYMKNKMRSASFDNSLIVKQDDDIVSATVDYKVLKWLTASLGMKQKKGVVTYTQSSATNQVATAKNIYTTPTFALKTLLRLKHNIIVTPQVALSRAFITQKAYIDNGGNRQNTRYMHLDQANFSTKIAYEHSAKVIPYVHGGYGHTLHYSAPIRSRHSYHGGLGVLLFKGVVDLSWSASKAYNSIIAQTVSGSVNIRF